MHAQSGELGATPYNRHHSPTVGVALRPRSATRAACLVLMFLALGALRSQADPDTQVFATGETVDGVQAYVEHMKYMHASEYYLRNSTNQTKCARLYLVREDLWDDSEWQAVPPYREGIEHGGMNHSVWRPWVGCRDLWTDSADCMPERIKDIQVKVMPKVAGVSCKQYQDAIDVDNLTIRWRCDVARAASRTQVPAGEISRRCVEQGMETINVPAEAAPAAVAATAPVAAAGPGQAAGAAPAGAIAQLPATAAAPAAAGSVRVTTTPSGAKVYVGGYLVGVSPVEVRSLAAGPTRVVARLTGYSDGEEPVLVQSGVTLPVELTLKKVAEVAAPRPADGSVPKPAEGAAQLPPAELDRLFALCHDTRVVRPWACADFLKGAAVDDSRREQTAARGTGLSLESCMRPPDNSPGWRRHAMHDCKDFLELAPAQHPQRSSVSARFDALFKGALEACMGPAPSGVDSLQRLQKQEDDCYLFRENATRGDPRIEPAYARARELVGLQLKRNYAECTSLSDLDAGADPKRAGGVAEACRGFLARAPGTDPRRDEVSSRLARLQKIEADWLFVACTQASGAVKPEAHRLCSRFLQVSPSDDARRAEVSKLRDLEIERASLNTLFGLCKQASEQGNPMAVDMCTKFVDAAPAEDPRRAQALKLKEQAERR